MRTCSFCRFSALAGVVGVTSLGGCAASRSAPMVLADSEISFVGFDFSVAIGSDWRLTGDAVGLWLLDSGNGGQTPMVFAIAANGRPEFIAGDSLGMLLITGDISAIATVLEIDVLN